MLLAGQSETSAAVSSGIVGVTAYPLEGAPAVIRMEGPGVVLSEARDRFLLRLLQLP